MDKSKKKLIIGILGGSTPVPKALSPNCGVAGSSLSITISPLYEAGSKGEKTVAMGSHGLGLREEEPLIVIMDCLLRYAKAHKRCPAKVLQYFYIVSQIIYATGSINAD